MAFVELELLFLECNNLESSLGEQLRLEGGEHRNVCAGTVVCAWASNGHAAAEEAAANAAREAAERQAAEEDAAAEEARSSPRWEEEGRGGTAGP